MKKPAGAETQSLPDLVNYQLVNYNPFVTLAKRASAFFSA